MAGNNLSPRQKMIGMMYLVLTALLALNTSKEIINAFVTINTSLEASVRNMDAKNDLSYRTFDKQLQNDPAKTKPFFDRAQAVRKLAKEIDDYIDKLKVDLIVKTDKIETGKAVELIDVQAKDNYDEPTRILCGDKQDGRGKKATELKTKIEEFKKKVVAALDPKDQAEWKVKLDDMFRTSDPNAKDKTDKVLIEEGKRTWEMANFYHNPVVASVCQLTKFQLDVKNAESDVVNHLLASINATDLKFSDVVAKVVAPTSYVIIGQEYTADVFLAAYNKTSSPEIVVGGSTLKVEEGMGKYTISPRSPGEQKWSGKIRVKGSDGAYKEYPFESSYMVSAPSASVSADSLNVFYIGIDNPVTISVPGVPAENVTCSATGVTLSPVAGGKGRYIARVSAGREATINVSAKMGDKAMSMGAFHFRIKSVPSPIARIYGAKGGKISKTTLNSMGGVSADMGDFLFNIPAKVTSFKMTVVYKGGSRANLVDDPSNSSAFTSNMKAAMQACKPGDKVLIDNIVGSVAGQTKSLESIILTVN
ncbi:MAG: gliding motility protein GldM [Bacteroidota bacterium]